MVKPTKIWKRIDVAPNGMLNFWLTDEALIYAVLHPGWL